MWVVLLSVLGLASGNYFRYGSVTWRRLNPDVVNTFEVEFDILLGINRLDPVQVGDTYTFDSIPMKFGDPAGTTASLTSTVISVDETQEMFFVNPVVTVVYPHAGPWEAIIESPENQQARWARLRNNDLLSFRLLTTVDMRNENYNSPVFAIPTIANFPIGETRYLFAYDPDGENATFRLSTAYELGDALVPANLGLQSQISRNPDGLVLSDIGRLEWTQPLIEKGSWNIQIMVSDERGGSVPIDFVINNEGNVGGTPPVVGGGGTPEADVLETFLVDTQVSFPVMASSPIGVPIASVRSVEPPTRITTGAAVSEPTGEMTQTFSYTPTWSGLRILCFYAEDVNASQSDMYCFKQYIQPDPNVYTLWMVPTMQVTGRPITTHFTGLFLAAADRVAQVVAGSPNPCSTLADGDGVQVEEVDGEDSVCRPGTAGVSVAHDGSNPWDPSRSYWWNVQNQRRICMARGMCYDRSYDGPPCFLPSPGQRKAQGVVNFRRSKATLDVGDIGLGILCYKLNAGTAVGIIEPWQQVRDAPPPFSITRTGPYQATSIVSCPVVDRPIDCRIDGIDLRRFDRMVLIRPSSLPPQLSDVNCEDLHPDNGTMVKDIPRTMVYGSTRVHVPITYGVQSEGLYVCYRPFEGRWRLLDYVRKPQSEGVYAMGSMEQGNAMVSLELMGIGLHPDDMWSVLPGRPDCPNQLTRQVDFTVPTSVKLTFPAANETYGIDYYTLCYNHQGTTCKVAEIHVGDEAYVYEGVPEPVTTTRQFLWVDYLPPGPVYEREMRYYEFTGYLPYGYNLNGPNIHVKIAKKYTCTDNIPGGEPRELDRDRRVAFKVDMQGIYRVCVKHRIDWEPVARELVVIPRPPTLAGTLEGWGTCAEYIRQNPALNACGCYVDVGASAGPAVCVDNDYLAAVGTTKLNLNQGCCTNPNAARVPVGTIDGPTKTWGHCTHISKPAPLIPFPCDA